jgi:hypothetical protein
MTQKQYEEWRKLQNELTPAEKEGMEQVRQGVH